MRTLTHLKILTLVLTVGILTGCAWFKSKPEVEYRTKTVLVTPPNELLVKCEVTTPPDRELYVKGSWEEKEKKLVNYSLSLITEIKKCNVTIDSVAEWKKRQELIYPSESKP